MVLLNIIIIAIGLSMDAFAVAVASGTAYKKLHIPHALRIALFFGGFQAIMPIIGYAAGMPIRDHIQGYDHWIAFGLLAIIGGKMIYESFKLKTQDDDSKAIQSMLVLLTLSIATSIDALAVGLTLSVLDLPIIRSAVIIGLITFILSYIGVYIGTRVGHLCENKIEVAGGLVLIAIGFKILIQHLA